MILGMMPIEFHKMIRLSIEAFLCKYMKGNKHDLII